MIEGTSSLFTMVIIAAHVINVLLEW